MTNTVTAITAKKFKATLNNEKIDVHYCRHVCLAYDVNKNPVSLKRAVNGYQNIKIKPSYFMDYPYSSENSHGAVIYKVPLSINDEAFQGTFDEYELEELEVLGTLLLENNKKIIETNLLKVEKIRRENIAKKIAKGSLNIIFTDDKEKNNNPDAYLKYLKEEDQKRGSYITRGHGNIYQ